jgi:hypothetical protein
MTWVAVAVGAGAVVSAGAGVISANKAGKAAQKGSDQSIAESQRQFDLVRSDTAGARFIGNGATNTLARLYGYGPVSTGAAGGPSTPLYSPSSGGGISKGNILKGGVKGAAMGLVDPIGGTFKQIANGGKLFGIGGKTHGDEKRNLNAFLNENQVYDLGDGKLALEDGTVFSQEDLQSLAGSWYGAKYAPDGNQAGWQRTYEDTLSGLVAKNGRTSFGDAGQTTAAPAGTAGQPDMSAFFESPDYQFNLNEGQKAIDRSAAARGGLLSGGAQKEGIRYASGMASREYSAFVDRLMQQAGLGNTGIGASAAAGANTASTVANAATNAANARGSAYLTAGSAINSGVQGGIQNLLLNKYLGG